MHLPVKILSLILKSSFYEKLFFIFAHAFKAIQDSGGIKAFSVMIETSREYIVEARHIVGDTLD